MLEPMRNHWWWRPGWRVGRSFYTWHLTLAVDPGARELVASYEPLLRQLSMLDAVPLKWLHLTVQGIGFTDEVNEDDLQQIIAAARARCAQLAPITLNLGPAHLDPETIQLPVTPLGPLVELRNTIRAAISDVWGIENVPEPAVFRPHVTLGYSNAGGPAEPIAEALAGYPPHTTQATATAISLIDLNRDHQEYQWNDIAELELGRKPQ